MPDAHNLADLVQRAAETAADRPALFSEDRAVTWSELDAQVDVVARGLHALRLTAAESETPTPDPASAVGVEATAPRIGIALPNTPEFAAAYFGVLRAGLVAVPVNPGYTARELRHVLADSGAAALIATEEVAAAVETVRAELPELVHVLSALPDAPGAPMGAPVTGGEDLAMLIYTSGTAGAPKGAMLSHRALIANHAQLAEISPPVLGADDIVLLVLPLFHAYGLNSGLGAVAYHAAAAVLVNRFDPVGALELVSRHHVTVVVGAPPTYVAWSLLPECGEVLANVRLAISGAAPLEPTAAARFTAATARPIFEGYGLTETAPVLTSSLASPVPKPGSIGRPIPGVELKLVGADGSVVWPSTLESTGGSTVEAKYEFESPGSEESDPGEIVVRGPNLFSGYWPDGHEGPDADGWWATGDVAYADEDGDLFLVDRLGELILVSGFNVYPHEIELVLTSHRGVADAAVLGIPHPYTGQTVKAYVVRAPGSDVSTEDLMRHCVANLARFKCPTAIEFVPSLPYSAIGKVRKAALRDNL